jgi:hypothetical protein
VAFGEVKELAAVASGAIGDAITAAELGAALTPDTKGPKAACASASPVFEPKATAASKHSPSLTSAAISESKNLTISPGRAALTATATSLGKRKFTISSSPGLYL